MDQAIGTAKWIAGRYGVWIVLGLMAIEIVIERRRGNL